MNAGNHRVIKAEHLQLSLHARKVRPGTRWAAMSNGVATPSCSPRWAGGGFRLATQPLLSPMTRGDITRCVARVHSQGRREVLATWGCGIRALQAEMATSIMHIGAAS